jgi:hypothetical protein
MSDTKPKNQINIELGEEQAEGIYANLAMISHSHSEFIIDFIKKRLKDLMYFRPSISAGQLHKLKIKKRLSEKAASFFSYTRWFLYY